MRRADLQARPTPRLGKLFLPVDPRQQHWPSDLPKAVRWLAARYVPPGTVLPLSLRPLGGEPRATAATGLHLLQPRNWLELDKTVFAAEMAKKRKLLLEPENPWHDSIFAAEPDTLHEQQELLEVVVANCLEHHNADYRLEVAGDGKRRITVLPTGDTYCVDDWLWKEDAKGRPVAIHLASLLVQEEFFILRQR